MTGWRVEIHWILGGGLPALWSVNIMKNIIFLLTFFGVCYFLIIYYLFEEHFLGREVRK